MSKNSIKNWFIWTIPVVLIIAGAVYLFTQNIYVTAAPIIAPAPAQVQHGALQSGLEKIPAEVYIANVGIKLNVQAGNFDQTTGKWAINNHDAFFAQGSSTTLFYGHNKPAVFGPLKSVGENDNLIVKYQDGTESHFIYSGTKFVKPEDVSVLNEQHTNTIMLLTCDGLFNDKRRIVYFKEIQ